MEADQVGLIEWTDAGFGEPTVNAEWLTAEAERLAELAWQAAADDHVAGADRSPLVVLQPAHDGKILRRAESNYIRGPPVDQNRDDAVARHPSGPAGPTTP